MNTFHFFAIREATQYEVKVKDFVLYNHGCIHLDESDIHPGQWISTDPTSRLDHGREVLLQCWLRQLSRRLHQVFKNCPKETHTRTRRIGGFRGRVSRRDALFHLQPNFLYFHVGFGKFCPKNIWCGLWGCCSHLRIPRSPTTPLAPPPPPQFLKMEKKSYFETVFGEQWAFLPCDWHPVFGLREPFLWISKPEWISLSAELYRMVIRLIFKSNATCR